MSAPLWNLPGRSAAPGGPAEHVSEDRGDFIRLCHFKYEAAALGAALRHIEAFIRGI
jgi:hypothetical protein